MPSPHHDPIHSRQLPKNHENPDPFPIRCHAPQRRGKTQHRPHLRRRPRLRRRFLVLQPRTRKNPHPAHRQARRAGHAFTDGHSSSGVCSPSRYTLLTGRYHWRGRLQKGIVGMWEPPAIPADRMTIATLAKQNGYRTACIGKWHLGWDWPIPKKIAILCRAARRRTSPPPQNRKRSGKNCSPNPSRRPHRARLRPVLRHRRAQLAALLFHRERPHRRHPQRIPARPPFQKQPGQQPRARPDRLETGAHPPRHRRPRRGIHHRIRRRNPNPSCSTFPSPRRTPRCP
jgi:arylsulfatase A-like enzyme